VSDFLDRDPFWFYLRNGKEESPNAKYRRNYDRIFRKGKKLVRRWVWHEFPPDNLPNASPGEWRLTEVWE
jgi:hypothetical protein